MGKTNIHCQEARRGEYGFTLIELLVTLSVAAILLAVAVPSYRGVVQRNAMAASVNDLVGDLNYARSQAVTRGQRVYLCKSSDQITCETSGDIWSQGWIVYAPDPGTTTPTNNNLLRVHGPLDGQVTISGNNNIKTQAFFDANGFATLNSSGTFTAKADNATQDTEVVISSTGRIRTEHVSSGGSP